MFIAALIIALLYILIQMWQLYILFSYKAENSLEYAEWPLVSVLVAARNEEKNLTACIEALVQSDYPQDRILILIGNDQSTDNTGLIAREFEKKHKNIKVIDIVDDDSGLKAKARVMAQLDKQAVGEFYLITDADVQVNPGWVKAMLGSMKPEIGVASGTTMVVGSGFMGRMQQLDWTYFMGLLNVISYSGIPATAVGNNMIVRATAYWQTGGYSNIRFSITEDYKLYSEICKKGWKWNNIMSPGTLAFSAPVSGIGTLMHQRKRWLSGGKDLPWYWWLLFAVFGCFYFTTPLLIYSNPVSGISLVMLKFFLQSLQIQKISNHLGQKRFKPISLIQFEIYIWIVTIATALFFVLPAKTNWKDRTYKV